MATATVERESPADLVGSLGEFHAALNKRLGDVVVAQSDLPEYQRINDRWADAARKLQQWPA